MNFIISFFNWLKSFCISKFVNCILSFICQGLKSFLKSKKIYLKKGYLYLNDNQINFHTIFDDSFFIGVGVAVEYSRKGLQLSTISFVMFSVYLVVLSAKSFAINPFVAMIFAFIIVTSFIAPTLYSILKGDKIIEEYTNKLSY